MANTFNGNRFVIDTAASTLLIGTLTHLLLPVKIIGIRWVGSTTNAHTAIIQDTNSVVVWESQDVTSVLGQPQ